MSITQKFFDRPIAFLLCLVLFCLFMCSIIGCTPEEFLIRMDDVKGRVNEVNASVDAMQLVMSSNIDFVKTALTTVLVGGVGAGGWAGVNKYRNGKSG